MSNPRDHVEKRAELEKHIENHDNNRTAYVRKVKTVNSKLKEVGAVLPEPFEKQVYKNIENSHQDSPTTLHLREAKVLAKESAKALVNQEYKNSATFFGGAVANTTIAVFTGLDNHPMIQDRQAELGRKGPKKT